MSGIGLYLLMSILAYVLMPVAIMLTCLAYPIGAWWKAVDSMQFRSVCAKSLHFIRYADLPYHFRALPT